MRPVGWELVVDHHGFAPLNFMSGGSVRDAEGNVMMDRTISDAGARSNVFLLGVNAAF